MRDSRTWRHPCDVVEKLLMPLLRHWGGFTAVVDDIIADDRLQRFDLHTGTLPIARDATLIDTHRLKIAPTGNT